MQMMIVIVLFLCMCEAEVIRLSLWSGRPSDISSMAEVLLWSDPTLWSPRAPLSGDDVVLDLDDLCNSTSWCPQPLFLFRIDVATPHLSSLSVGGQGRYPGRNSVQIVGLVWVESMTVVNSSVVWLNGGSIRGTSLSLLHAGVIAGTGVVAVTETLVDRGGNVAPGITLKYYGELIPSRSCCWPGLIIDGTSQLIEEHYERYGTLEFAGTLTVTSSAGLWIKDKGNTTLHHSGRVAPLVDIDRIVSSRFVLSPDPNDAANTTLRIPLIGNANSTELWLQWQTVSLPASMSLEYERRGGFDGPSAVFPIRPNDSVLCRQYCPGKLNALLPDPDPLATCTQAKPIGLSVLLAPSECNSRNVGGCPECLNGGFCSVVFGICSCPMGTVGPTCENATSISSTTSALEELSNSLVLGLAIGIPLAVLFAIGVALAIVLISKHQTVMQTDRANKELRDEEANEMGAPPRNPAFQSSSNKN